MLPSQEEWKAELVYGPGFIDESFMTILQYGTHDFLKISTYVYTVTSDSKFMDRVTLNASFEYSIIPKLQSSL